MNNKEIKEMIGKIVWYIEPLDPSQERRWGFICEVLNYNKVDTIIITTFQTTKSTAFLYTPWKGEYWDIMDP
jgi:hypothetical protein